jgi:hypothetical protein
MCYELLCERACIGLRHLNGVKCDELLTIRVIFINTSYYPSGIYYDGLILF